jgi:hypothetical protein
MTQARLKKIFHESLLVELSKVPSLDSSRTLHFYNRLMTCFKSPLYLQKMTQSPFALVLDPTKIGGGRDYLDPNVITDSLNRLDANMCNIFVVDYEGKNVADPTYDEFIIDGDDIASKVSEDYHLILFYIRQLAVKVYVNGSCRSSTENIHSAKRTGEVRPSDVPPSQYRLLINKHFNEKLREGKNINYWHSKPKRILKQKPEDYFKD